MIRGGTTKVSYKMHGFFRFFLALMVLWSHSFGTFFPELDEWSSKFQLGNVAVSSFFVLSGYLMYEAIINFYSNRLPFFLVNRYLRIGPPLFLAAIVSILIHLFAQQAGTINNGIESVPVGGISLENALIALLSPLYPLFNTKLAGLFGIIPETNFQFVRYSWAIATELIFYWILFLFALCKNKLGVQFAGTCFLFTSLMMFVISIANYNGYLEGTLLEAFLKPLSFFVHLQWAPHFLVGIMMSCCVRNRWKSILPNLILVFAAILSLTQLGIYASNQSSPEISKVLGGYLVTLGVGFSLILNDRQYYSLGRFFLNRKRDSQLGNLSYPIYINHYSLSLALLSLTRYHHIHLENLSIEFRVSAYGLYILIIILISALLIHLTDTMTNELRNRIRGVSL